MKFIWSYKIFCLLRDFTILDGPKVGTVALSPRGDWRMPSDACVALWIQNLEKEAGK